MLPQFELDTLNQQAEALLSSPPRLGLETLKLRGLIEDAARAMNESGEHFNGAMQASYDAGLHNLDRLLAHYADGQQRADEEARRAALHDRLQAPGTSWNAVPRVTSLVPRSTLAPGAGFHSFGDYLLAVRDSFLPGTGRRDERLDVLAATGMAGSSGTTGGFMVPMQFSSALLTAMQGRTEALLPRTTNFPIAIGDSIQLPVSAETSRATGSRWGGIRSTWIAEGEQKPTSFPTVRQMQMTLKELAILVPVNDRLLRSGGPAVEQYVRMAALDELVVRTNEAIVRGSGVGMPLGILGSTGLITLAKETSQTTATVIMENVNAMFSRLLPQARASAVWLVNTEVLSHLESMTVGGPNNLVPVYIPAMGGIPSVSGTPLALSPTPLLKGLPVLEIEACSAVGVPGDLILCNLSWVASLTRSTGVEEAVSMHLYFDFDQTAFRFVLEVDAQPMLATPITPAYGTAGRTLSAYVALAARP